jgi:dTDP-4-dehydrorhamnose reductase
MRVVVLGAAGMLGTDVVSELKARNHEATALDLQDIDITDPTDIARLASGEFGGADWVVNCAAYTAVDKAEDETMAATGLNAIAPGYIAMAVQGLGAKLIHISTDFVFDGTSTEPYTEDAKTNPLGVYGRTKRDGEENVLNNNSNAIIVRTAWLYGPNGGSFPRTMIRAWEGGKQLKVVADQHGCPTYTADLARVITDLIEKNAFPGIYHAVGPDAMTWHEFALRAIRTWSAQHGGGEVSIEPIKTEDWPTPATRPKFSVLSTEKLQSLGIEPMSPVDEALTEFCARLSSQSQ